MAKLNMATLERMDGDTRGLLRRGMLHVALTPAPHPSRSGYQAPFSGHHFSRHAGPLLLQFPAEITKEILSYLEPIWLFQVAAAYPRIDHLLCFETSNRIWYDAIPAGLFLEPECFQDESLVKDRMLASSKGNETDTTLEFSNNAFRSDTFYFDAIRSPRIVVPAITNLSQLALDVEFPYDIRHPHNQQFYPTTPTRIRNMALGGPFQPWLDYRRELAGHLHCGMRCFICLELVGKYGQYKYFWGMTWCNKCYELHMLNPSQLAEIPGLNMLIRRGTRQTAIHLDMKPPHYQYRPMVDEILRTTIGVDFETAIGVQKYMQQLLEKGKGGLQSEPLKRRRRKIRGDIVKRAQEIWEGTRLNGREDVVEHTGNAEARRQATAKKIIVHTRQRWAPTSMLPNFLFAARHLSSSDEWLPHDSDARWLEDPTLDLKTSRDVYSLAEDWVDQKAKEMLLALVVYTPNKPVTTWIQAAEKWHIRRIKHDLDSGKYLNLEYGGVRLERPEVVATSANNRLDVVAKKLRMDPLFPVGTLTEHERRMAVASFNKIILHRCSGCPLNNLLILPCGLEQIVRHFGDYHPYHFWLNDKWTIRG